MQKHMTIINLACTITKLRKWGEAWKHSAESAQANTARLHQANKELEREKFMTAGLIDKLIADRDEAWKERDTQTADHEAKMVEHRAAFGVRTEADAKIIAGLRQEVQALREALAKEQELHAKTALRMATDAAKLAERKHPVKVGEYVKRLTGFNTTLAGEIGKVTRVDDDDAEIEYEVKRQNGKTGVWCAKNCEPCDPPNHDTEAGKAAAEAAVKTEPVADEIKVGDLVEVFQATDANWTRADEIGIKGTVQRINMSGRMIPVVYLSNDGAYALRDVRKIRRGPKPGDTVRLVRIPSRDDVSSELKTELEWPWIERWGTLNQTALVVEPAYQLDGALSVCLSTNVHVRWPISCIEVITEATHDTEAGKAAAQNAEKTEQVADEIKVGDLVEVVSNRGRNTWLADVGSFGTVMSVEEINDSISVHLDAVPGKKNALGGYVSLCDVRKVTT